MKYETRISILLLATVVVLAIYVYKTDQHFKDIDARTDRIALFCAKQSNDLHEKINDINTGMMLYKRHFDRIDDKLGVPK